VGIIPAVFLFFTHSTPHDFAQVVQAAAQVMAGEDVSAYPLDDRQLRASRRLQWRREVRPLSPESSSSSSSPRSKKGRRGKRSGGLRRNRRRRKPHGPQGGSLETWRWRRNEPPPVPVPDANDGDDDESSTSKSSSLGGWVKASFSVSGGLPSSEKKRREAALVAAKLEADDDVIMGGVGGHIGSSSGGYARLAGDSAGTLLPTTSTGPSTGNRSGSLNATPTQKARATSFNNPLLSLFGSNSSPTMTSSSHPLADPESNSSGNLQEPLLEPFSSSSSSMNDQDDEGGTAAATTGTAGTSTVGAAVSAAAAATSSFFFGARNDKNAPSSPDIGQPSDLAAYHQWSSVAVAVESDAFCWEAVGSDSEDDADKEGNEIEGDDDDDDDDEKEGQLPAKEHPELAAFGELKEGYSTSELRLVGMAPFRDKHAWFDSQLRDRVQVPWAVGHLTLEIDRHDLLESSVEGLLRQV